MLLLSQQTRRIPAHRAWPRLRRLTVPPGQLHRWEREVKEALLTVMEPYTKKSLVSIGALQGIRIDNSHNVRIDLDLFVPGYPYWKAIETDCLEAMRRHLAWARDVEIHKFSARSSSSKLPAASNLSNVEHIVAISSCKGGVGKSTVAANLAMTLVKRGLRVGLLDADIYGPSLPLMLRAKDSTVRRAPQNAKQIMPLETKEGLRILSFGHVNPKAGAPGAGGRGPALMRGPIASRVINQLVASTDWGHLDYLLVDMPPGTGDVQISLTQAVRFSGAVIVTTPHPLSLIDAAKGVEMFDELKVPPLAIVENMAYFTCDLGTRYFPFGRGGRNVLLRGLQTTRRSSSSDEVTKRSPASCGAGDSSMQSADTVSKASSSFQTLLEQCPMHQLPLAASIAGEYVGDEDDQEGAEEARLLNCEPVVSRYPESEAATIYSALADDVISEIMCQQLAAQLLPSITYVPDRGIVLRYFTASSVREWVLPTLELRLRDPRTGRRITGPGQMDENALRDRRLHPLHFDYKGSYGVAISWSDGHYADIFPFDILKKIAEECASK